MASQIEATLACFNIAEVPVHVKIPQSRAVYYLSRSNQSLNRNEIPHKVSIQNFGSVWDDGHMRHLTSLIETNTFGCGIALQVSQK
jgi:hypothetical protein